MIAKHGYIYPYSVVCEGCKEEGPPSPSELDATQNALEDGWTFEGNSPITGEWMCPECQREAEALELEYNRVMAKRR